MTSAGNGTDSGESPVAEEDRTEGNREAKDAVFSDLFGRKPYALSLFNAFAGTDIDDLDSIEITTLKNVLFMNRRNDVSCRVNGMSMLWEHQSTINPNMPLRSLLYFGQLLSKYVKTKNLNIYSSKLLQLPTPRIYVLYNGVTKAPEKRELVLFDAFGNDSADVWARCRFINIREGMNKELMSRCAALAGYAHLIQLVEDNLQTMPRSEAIHRAVKQCIKDGYLVEYLTERGWEVEGMLLEEYDEAAVMAAIREEAREEGREEGHKEGREEDRKELCGKIAALVASDSLSFDDLAGLFDKGQLEAAVRDVVAGVA